MNVDACDWDVLERFVEDLGTTGQISFESVGSEETQEQLRELLSVARNLGQKYDAVVTNPPYLGGKRLIKTVNISLRKIIQKESYDLYSSFMIRCKLFAKEEKVFFYDSTTTGMDVSSNI